MSKIHSQADIILDLDGLVTAVRENAAQLPSTEPHRLALEGMLTDLKGAKALQGARRAGKQKATQDLGDLIRRSRDLATRLRGAVKADLGLRSEELVHYGIAPARPRPRRATTTAVKAPTGTPAHPPAPAAPIGAADPVAPAVPDKPVP